MAQQTRLEVVVAYFDRFVARFPTIAALANATDDEVTAAWSGLGYYRRARMLRDGAKTVVERFRGKLPRSVDELLTIPGIGRYTAGAIASIAYDVAAPIVDGNVARVVSRLFGIEERIGSPALMRDAWTRAETLVDAAKSPRDFNQGLMEIGALICKPRKPLCLVCPLRAQCATRSDRLPLSKLKGATREMRIPLYVVSDRRGRVLMRRESGRLMNAMFHLPHGDSSLFGAAPLKVDRADAIGTFRHTVTNRRITFEVFSVAAVIPSVARKLGAKVAQGRSFAHPTRPGPSLTLGMTYEWISPHELSAIPHPSYVQKALRLAGIEIS